MNGSDDRDAYSRLGNYLSQKHSDQLSTQLAVFQSALINFAEEHGDQIKSNNEFRMKFTEMCQLVGLDPLELMIYTSSKNPKRTENFYITLSVKIVEICQETRDLNGGLISIKDLLTRLQNNGNFKSSITEQDISESLKVLESLGQGYEILMIKDKKWLKFSLASTVESNISNDQKKIYEICTFMGGYVTYRLLMDNYGWDRIRCKSVIDEMIMNGFLWVDSQGDNGQSQFWEPSWIS